MDLLFLLIIRRRTQKITVWLCETSSTMWISCALLRVPATCNQQSLRLNRMSTITFCKKHVALWMLAARRLSISINWVVSDLLVIFLREFCGGGESVLFRIRVFCRWCLTYPYHEIAVTTCIVLGDRHVVTVGWFVTLKWLKQIRIRTWSFQVLWCSGIYPAIWLIL